MEADQWFYNGTPMTLAQRDELIAFMAIIGFTYADKMIRKVMLEDEIPMSHWDLADFYAVNREVIEKLTAEMATIVTARVKDYDFIGRKSGWPPEVIHDVVG